MSARAERRRGSRGRSAESVRNDERVCPLWQDFEPLALGGLTEALIERHERVTRDTGVGPHEGCGELQGIRGAERMQQKHAPGRFADLMAWLNLGPVSGEAGHGVSGLVFVSAREDIVASPPCEGGIAFDRCRPPDDQSSVRVGDPPHEGSRRFFHAERNDGRGVPELHRPPSRSSRRAFSTAPVGSAGRGIFQKPFGSFPDPSRMSPARASSRTWGGNCASSRPKGTIFAIGFPRSVTMISSPALTRARYSLRLAFSLATAALFMGGLL